MKILMIVVIMAMFQEAEPFVNRLGLQKIVSTLDKQLPIEVFKGKVNKSDVILIVNGKDKRFGVDNVGTQPATLSTYLAINNFNPNLLINAGTAGGFHAKGANIGDIYIGSDFIRFHDRRIPIPGFKEYGVGSYKVPDFDQFATDLGLKKGIISTGNSLDMIPKDLEMIKANEAVIKDMEAAAIAWVAELYNIPLITLKSITDLVDSKKPTQDEFMKNLSLASENLQKKLIAAINFCAGKTINEIIDRA